MIPLHLASHNTANDTATITAFVLVKYGYFISSLARRHSSSFANVSTPSQILPSLSVLQVKRTPSPSMKDCKVLTVGMLGVPPFSNLLIVLAVKPTLLPSDLTVNPSAVLANLHCVLFIMGICTNLSLHSQQLMLTKVCAVGTLYKQERYKTAPKRSPKHSSRPNQQNPRRS